MMLLYHLAHWLCEKIEVRFSPEVGSNHVLLIMIMRKVTKLRLRKQ